ncbi:site-specific integrase [Bradyrhizobium canariense]|uniref:site-specific integrase n=1 Tax=Bradyrhizobium canariense TaxID=255045 RepID=UPI001B8A7639|nr:site-specific integrase [Bradyrhizobium canariense]MBR0954143.1 site-specific integrase [Bradyrhizobium canariense]
MPNQRITKRTVDRLQASFGEFTVWDSALTGFGVRVRPTGAKSYVVVYRAGAGRGAPVRRFTIAAASKITPERARARAKAILGAVAHGLDPADQKATERGTPTVTELADRFMAEHVRAKRKTGTAEFYRDILDRIVKPALGTTKADKLTRLQVRRLHSSLSDTPFQANRVLAVVGSMYTFAGSVGIVPEGTNPGRAIDKFKEDSRERFLTGEELERLGAAIREAETAGIPWTVDETKAFAKHVAKAKRFTRIAPSAAAALRLLLLTGCRLREILHLRWEHVDFERGCLFLPDSKSGRKTVILNAPSLAILNELEHVGPYVVPGDNPEKPRHDLKRPWIAVTRRAELIGVRLHDLRHTYASFGAGFGLGLPIIGKLLGHAHSATTARYAHLDNDPLRHASEAIASRIAAALDRKPEASHPPAPKTQIAGRTKGESRTTSGCLRY